MVNLTAATTITNNIQSRGHFYAHSEKTRCSNRTRERRFVWPQFRNVYHHLETRRISEQNSGWARFRLDQSVGQPRG